MKMLLAKIVNPEFQASLEKLGRQDIPIRGMYKMRGILKLLREEVTKFEELRNELAVRYADRNDDSKSPLVEKKTDSVTGKDVLFYKMDKEKVFQFSAEVGQLVKVEVEVPEVSLKDLGDEIKLNASDLLLLEFITVEE